MVTGLPMVFCGDGVCSGCVLKKHQDNFDKCAYWHALVPLELVHSDLCGPLLYASFSGFKYSLTFIDDYSRRTWVYFLKHKTKVLNMFLAYKALVEKQYDHQILKLRSDNGGEYVNNKLLLSALNKESNNTLFHMHHNKMVQLSEKNCTLKWCS